MPLPVVARCQSLTQPALCCRLPSALSRSEGSGVPCFADGPVAGPGGEHGRRHGRRHNAPPRCQRAAQALSDGQKFSLRAQRGTGADAETPRLTANPARRQVLAGSLLALSAGACAAPALALEGMQQPPKSALPASLVVDMSTWPLIIGEGFVLKVPPGYRDILPPPDAEGTATPSWAMQNNAPKSPFIARFASQDGAESISVILQPATKLKITFLELDDVSEFGPIDEAAKFFMSQEARILARRSFTAAWLNKKARTYYLYEFLSGGLHVAMNVCAAGGYVFVMAASTPEERWRPAAAQLRASVGAFQLTV